MTGFPDPAPAPAPDRAGLRPVIALVAAPTPAAAAPHEEALGLWDAQAWAGVLRRLPIDAHTFLGELEQPWEAVIEGLDRWCRAFPARPEADRRRLDTLSGRLGLLLLTLVALRHSYLHRYAADHPDAPAVAPALSTHDCAAQCVPLVQRPAVRAALRELYAPEPGDGPAAAAEWERIDFGSLAFHRHGTTSFILSGLPAAAVQGRRRPLALKLILYPYLRVPTIVRATRAYARDYEVPGIELRRLAHTWASGGRWILMDFVPGETLGEYLQRQAPARNGQVRLDLLTALGPELFTALADLERVGKQHLDLSPSNVILREDGNGGHTFVLVDLGVNYLSSHAVPGSEELGASYVAPEVRTGDGRPVREALADLYSAGRLLAAMAGAPLVPGRQGPPVPDACYAESLVLARFLEDLTDRDPKHRLRIFRPDPRRPLYPQLLTFFREELAAVTAAREERGTGLGSLYRPLVGAPARARRMWSIRRTQELYRDPRRGMHVRWLLFWSWVSAGAWYVAAGIVVTWWLRDIGWNWGGQVVTVLQRAGDASEDEFPVLDALRADNYPIPDFRGNLPVRMVGLSFMMAGARYYQNIFAGLTTLATGAEQGRLSVLALLAEVSMRAFSLIPATLVLLPTLLQRDWWPLCTAAGVVSIFLCNLSCLLFARESVRRARERGLSTVPSGRIAGLESFANWTPSAAFYASACCSIGTLIYLGEVRDVYVYAGSVTAINTVLFYAIKCSGTSAADVRTALGRACLAAERLRYT